MTTDRLPKILLKIINSEDTEISDDPYLDGRTYSLEIGNRPMAYVLEKKKNVRIILSHNVKT
jgi:hypothetical protein